jgi:hypothetical protein
MAFINQTSLLLGVITLFLLVRPTHAFGAGNIAGISKVEGQNCELLSETRKDPVTCRSY